MKKCNVYGAILKIILLSLFSVLMFNVKSYATSDFTYTLAGNKATITGYTGTNSDVVIPGEIDGYKVYSIGNHAFDGRTTNGKNFVNVTISDGITEIGDFAFLNCEKLQSIILPESINDLGFQTFIGCNSLKNITIPKNVINIPNACFQETAISEIIIPENVQIIDDRAFFGCKNLKKVVVYSKNLAYYIVSLLQPDEKKDNRPFENCPEDMVIYGYVGSTTEEYASEHGYIFKDISTLSEENTDNNSIENIVLNKTSLSLKIGESETLIATILPESVKNEKVIWNSSNNNIATVTEGKVTAKDIGEAIITVSTEDGKVKTTCKVTVSKKNTNEEQENQGGNNVEEQTGEDKGNNNEEHKTEENQIDNKEEHQTEENKGDNNAKYQAEENQIDDNIEQSKKEIQKDKTMVNGILPNTGVNYILIILSVVFSIIAIIMYKHYRNLKKI